MAIVNTSSVARHHVISIPNYVKPLLSGTSEADDCFVRQRFSRKLQEFMVSYSATVTSPLTLTDESYPIIEQSVSK